MIFISLFQKDYAIPGFSGRSAFSFCFRTLTPIILDQNYISLKYQVIKAERRVLKELGFCVHVKHPHKVRYLIISTFSLALCCEKVFDFDVFQASRLEAFYLVVTSLRDPTLHKEGILRNI